MLVPYESLQQLPSETIENLIKEYLFTQVEDGGFADTDNEALKSATHQCKALLKQGVLVVEFSEDDESIAIKQAQHINY
ncbi:YheU family protein [Shewanella eurypsychrophilus]|uniref:YheU family protein n=1 Tax=Shewanella eurypsychrophilus TaxID=2593656 RepID=A0ABX6VAE9_9GAMM|nr:MULTISPECIES: YheU family protein [Shewanella]QFU24403.1 YheU family protein [Shewanella sp. YLB-09]QPG59603.1 YheU family protein [Shewanella eurypsychrophilus]